MGSVIRIIRSVEITSTPNATTVDDSKKTKVIVRDKAAQATTELKVKKMNGEVLTASIGEMIKMKQEERNKSN